MHSKKFHTELRKVQLAQRSIGRSTTIRKNTKVRCVNSLVFRERRIMHGRGNWEKQTGSGTHGENPKRSVRLHKSYGYRRITIHLQRKLGLQINHKAVLRLMGKLGIRSQARKPKMCKKLEEIGTYHPIPTFSIETLSRQSQTRSGSRMSPHSHFAGLGVFVHHQGSLRWLYCGTCL
ncbi:MAG: transposase [Anaerolineales bacterium]|nr:transposase [Anaerolineales bacterium]